MNGSREGEARRSEPLTRDGLTRSDHAKLAAEDGHPIVVLSTFSASQMDILLTADPSIFKAPADVHFLSLARNACTAS
jgi:hypothetical protein